MLQQLSAVGAVVHDLFSGQFVHGRAVQIVCQLCTACGQCVVQLAALHIAQDLLRRSSSEETLSGSTRTIRSRVEPLICTAAASP